MRLQGTVLLVVLVCLALQCASTDVTRYDLAIRAGLLIDGTGAEPLRDVVVLIQGNSIEAIVDDDGQAHIAAAKVMSSATQSMISSWIAMSMSAFQSPAVSAALAATSISSLSFTFSGESPNADILSG